MTSTIAKVSVKQVPVPVFFDLTDLADCSPTSISTTANKMTHSRFIFISTKVYKSGCKKKEGGAIRRGGCTALLLFSYRTGCLSPCDPSR